MSSKNSDVAGPSVIIPARNAASVIEEQLAALSVQDHDGDWELIVVDNGSMDGTAQVAQRWAQRFPRFTIVRSDRIGIARARNDGAARAAGDLLVFCDADDRAAPTWLSALAAASGTADVLGGRLDMALLNSDRARRARLAGPMADLPRAMDFLPYAIGANMAVRRSVFTALGGFDEAYVDGGADDVEFCLRAQLAGWSLAFVPDAVIHYRLRHTLRSIARQQFNYGRADPRLLRDFRAHGMRAAESGGEAFRDWARIALRGWSIFSPDRIGPWMCEASWRAGRAWGSWRNRVWCL